MTSGGGVGGRRASSSASSEGLGFALGDHELVEREPSFRKMGPPAVSILPDRPGNGDGDFPGFDVCREYGYRYEYADQDEDDDYGSDDDRDVSASRHVTGPGASSDGVIGAAARPATGAGAGTVTSGYPRDGRRGSGGGGVFGATYLLGREYHPVTDYAPRRDRERSLFWMTYRTDFPPIRPYDITTDAGWGCMLRSAQMMLAQALRAHFRESDWVPPMTLPRRRTVPFVRDVLTWFADFPSAPPPHERRGGGDGSPGAGMGGVAERRGQHDDKVKHRCWYSLHNMVAAGVARYETLPGEWYGPGTACHVLRDLCEMHERGDGGYCARRYGRPPPRVHVAIGGCVYQDEVEALMTRDSSARDEGSWTTVDGAGVPSLTNEADDPLSALLDHPLRGLGDSNGEGFPSPPPKPEWDTSLLLLIPLRLGLKVFDAKTYGQTLARSFSLSQSVGFLGGSPRHALWYYGASLGGDSDNSGERKRGTRVFGLDPHTVQYAPRRGGGGDGAAVTLSDAYLRSVHCSNPETMDVERIDPSLALGFYCRDRKDFESLRSSLVDARTWRGEGTETEKNGVPPEMFSVADAAPDYSADVSAAMAEMMMSTGSNQGASDLANDGGEDSDEDEYVML